jgi:glycosyltransferase involved in cell wall biosynthesis
MLSRRLSVVVPTHNKRRSLMKTLASLEQCDRAGRDIEVIVVDDASKDGTGTHLDGLQIGLPCKRLRNEQGLGPAASRNLGARQSAGELLLFLDDDMVCEPGLIRAHLVHHAFCADVAVVGRALYHPDLKRTALTRFFDAQHLRHSSPTCPPLRFSSNNVSLSRSLFERVGGFDESFACVGLEDIDLGMRLTQVPGCVIRYEPEACAYHFHDQSLRDYMRKIEEVGAHNLPLLAAKSNVDLGRSPLGWLLPQPGDDAVRRIVRAVLLIPGADALLVPLVERVPGRRINRAVIKYLFASSILRGFRRSQAAAADSGPAVERGPSSRAPRAPARNCS